MNQPIGRFRWFIPFQRVLSKRTQNWGTDGDESGTEVGRTNKDLNRSLYKLTAADIKRAPIGKTLYDGGGLEITKLATALRCVYQFTSPVLSKRREMGVTLTTLKAARGWRDPLRKRVLDGYDPLEEAAKRIAAERSAKEAAERDSERQAATLQARAIAYHGTIAKKFRNPKHRRQWLSSLENSLPERLWLRPIAGITEGELLDAMLELRDRVPETASRVRQRLEAVWADAIMRRLCDRNVPAIIARSLRDEREKRHLRALHYRDVAAFVVVLRAEPSLAPGIKRAIEFAILTASRSGEVRGARWEEFDLEARLWSVPPKRMKRAELHRVHLSPRALEILSEARAARTDMRADALVFPSVRGTRILSDMALTMPLRRLETGRKDDDGKPQHYAALTTMHGLARTTFSTWAHSEIAESNDVVEAALAHREVDRVKAAYDRSRTEGERFERELKALRMAWSNYVTAAPSEKVVKFAKR